MIQSRKQTNSSTKDFMQIIADAKRDSGMQMTAKDTSRTAARQQAAVSVSWTSSRYTDPLDEPPAWASKASWG